MSARGKKSAEGPASLWIADWLWIIGAAKPGTGAIVALINGNYLAENQVGIPAVLPEAVSLVLLILAFRCRRRLYLSRVWAWVILLASAGFSNRAFRDFGENGITTPEIEWMIVFPLVYLVWTGAFRRLLVSWSPLVRWGACGFVISLLPLVPLIWEKYPDHASWAFVFVYGGFLLAAFAGAKVFNLTEVEL